MMNNTTVVAAIALGILAAVLTYNYINQSEPTSSRLDNAVNQLGNGNVGEAVDELNNQTRGDKMADDLQDVINTNPAPVK